MLRVYEGEKKDVAVKVERTRGSGSITVTTPQYRILNASRAVVTGYSWANATWDGTNNELYALFDSTVAVLNDPGIYYVQLRGVIGSERYFHEVPVEVVDTGPSSSASSSPSATPSASPS